MIKTIEWTDEGVKMIDQRKLPTVEEYPVFKTYEEVAEAIRSMVIRGAPAIGVAAAMGVALGVRDSKAKNLEGLRSDFEQITKVLASTRPTAVNLFWAIERMKRLFKELADDDADRRTIADQLIQEALAIQTEDIENNKRMGRFGQQLLPDSGTVLTHCNAGALATAGYGTALGVIRAAVESGKHLRVVADETRPFLQGARLTAWELWKDDIDVRIVPDGVSVFNPAFDVTPNEFVTAIITDRGVALPPYLQSLDRLRVAGPAGRPDAKKDS